MSKQPVQLRFEIPEMRRNHPAFVYCEVCRFHHARGFPCWYCGMAERGKRRTAAIKTRTCATAGCGRRSVGGTNTYCGPDHQRAQAIEYRPILLSAMHSSNLRDAKKQEKQVQYFVRAIAEVDQVLGAVLCD